MQPTVASDPHHSHFREAEQLFRGFRPQALFTVGAGLPGLSPAQVPGRTAKAPRHMLLALVQIKSHPKTHWHKEGVYVARP